MRSEEQPPSGDHPQHAPVELETAFGPPIFYRVDAQDVIIDIGQAWEGFASENHGDSAFGDHVLGTSMYDHIVDDPTRQLYRDLLAEVRRGNEMVRFDYRCDSPQLCRQMRMLLVPREAGSVDFYSETLWVQPRRLPLHVQHKYGAFPALIRCSLCGRVRQKGKWQDVIDAVQEGFVLNHELPLLVAYGVCDQCRDAPIKLPLQKAN